MKNPFNLFTTIILLLAANFCCAQQPDISYSTPQVYKYNVAINPLAPSNSGGAVTVSPPVTLGTGFSNLTSVAVDGAGNVYFTANGSQTVEMIPAAGGSAVKLGFDFISPTGVAVDAAGNVYVADFGNSEIKEIPAGGGNMLIIGSGFFQPYGVAADGSGNLFISDRGSNTIRKLVLATGVTTTYASGFNSPTGIAVDAAGNVYVTDRGNNAIKKITPDGTITTVTSGNGNPNGVAVDAAGNIYFADTNNKTIIEVAAGGGTPVSIGSGFSSPAGVAVNPGGDVYVDDNRNTAIKKIPRGGYTLSPALPPGLTFDNNTGIISGTPTVITPAANYKVIGTNSSGSSAFNINLAVSPPDKPRISYSSPQVYPGRVTISPLAPVSSGGAIPAGGYTITPALPKGLAFDTNTGTISGMPITQSPATNYTVTAANLGGSGQATVNITVNLMPKPTLSYPGPSVYLVNTPLNPPLTPQSNGVGTAGNYFTDIVASGLNNLQNLGIDDAGNIYVIRTNPNILQKIPVDGSAPVTLVSGLNGAACIAVDGPGNVYFADQGNILKKIPTGGGAAVTVATGLNSPSGIALTIQGDILVADRSTGIIRIVQAGSSSAVPLYDSLGPISGLVEDNSFNKYFTDSGNNRIYKIPSGSKNAVLIAEGSGSPNGIVLDVNGNVYYVDANDSSVKEIPAGGGPAISIGTGLSSPYGLAIDKSGILYVTDINNNAVKKITPSGGYYISPAVSAGLTFNSSTGVISGTPTKITAVTNYVVTAFNAGGYTAAVANVKISYNKDLSSLSISPGTLNPAFDPSVLTYNVVVPDATPSVKFTATAVTPNAYIFVNNQDPYFPLPLTDGLNKFYVIVRQPDSVKQTYVVNVIRGAANLSSNAVLKSIKINPSTGLSITTGPGYVNYTTSVPFTQTSLTVTPATQDASATITVNGATVASGTASTSIPLAIGDNVITLVCTAQDGVTTKTYIITAKRAGSSTATLSNLALSAGALSPAFSPATIGYTVTVPYTTASIRLTPTVTDATATIKVNGVSVPSETLSGVIALNVGSNTITTIVTAQDGTTTKTYTITVTRAAAGLSTNAALSVIALAPKTTLTSNGTVNGVTSYATSVPFTESSLTVTPTAQDANAAIKINGVAVTSGTASQPIPLAVGTNVITLVCTAQDGVTARTYTITATRATGNTTATLANLALSTGTLTPVFATATTSYTAMVPYATASIRLTPTVTDATAAIKINGVAVPSGGLSGVIALNAGSNIITTVVTAQDGTTTKTYTLTITRAASNLSANAALSVLSVTPKATLTTTTGPGYKNYTVTVPNTTNSIQVTPTAQDANAAINVNGTAVASGTLSQAIALNAGTNTINIAVTAQDGVTVKNYIITVTRTASAIATLSNLVISTGALSPAFASATSGYTAIVPYAAASIRIAPTATDPAATIKVNGTAVTSGSPSGVIALNVGSNTITTIVTAQNGITIQTYTTTVTRAAANLSTNAVLSVIALTPKTTLAAATGPGYKNYTASVANGVSSVQVTPTAQDANATITVNSKAVASGKLSQAIPLAVGANTITTIVTAQDGATTKSYIITVTRAAAPGLVMKYDEPAAMPIQAGVTVHQGLSPNGDGNNDVLIIDGIVNYPENTLQIMSRSGELVYQVKGYDNRNRAFDGTSNFNGKQQPAGTYFYSLDYKDGGETKHKTGFIVLKY